MIIMISNIRTKLFRKVNKIMKKNPEVKVGDKIRILEARNGQGIIYPDEIWTVTKLLSNNNIQAKSDASYNVSTFYNTGPADRWILADKPHMIKYYREMIKEYKNNIKEAEQELEFLTKYEDEAEFVADKIDQLLKTDGIKAKAKVLRELKKSHYI